MARSTGASARAVRIEPAMMMPRGRLLVDHQIGADGEHRRLQHHAQHLGDRAETAGDVAGALIAREIVRVGFAPAPGQPPGHAHRDQHFGVAPAIDAMAERFVEVGRDADENAAANEIEHAEEHEQHGGENGQADERCELVARHHAIVNFQHEKSRGQRQDADHAAEQENADEGRAARGKCRRQLLTVGAVPVKFPVSRVP